MRPWATAFLLLIGAACATPTAYQSDAINDVKAVWATQVAAWNRADLDGFMSAYWKSSDLVFFSNGDETRGWEATPQTLPCEGVRPKDRPLKGRKQVVLAPALVGV